MRKFVMVKPGTSHLDIPYCTADYFARHIKNSPMRVTWETADKTGVKDEEGEEHVLLRSLVEEVKPKEACLG